MLSIKQKLTSFANHLPPGYTADQGVRKLFPDGYKGSISLLRLYVSGIYCQLITNGFGYGPYCTGSFWLMADGRGYWHFGWIYGDSNAGADYKRQAGFVFKYSPNINGYGYVDTSAPAANIQSCSSGQNDVIAQNWPELFSKGIYILFQLGSTLDSSLVWTNAGFGKTNYVSLNPVNVSCDSRSFSGSAFFPFPIIGPDVYVAAIIASGVANALLNNNNADKIGVEYIKPIVDSTEFISSNKELILTYLSTDSNCATTIADATVITKQIFYNETQTQGQIGKLSSQVTKKQHIAASVAATNIIQSFLYGKYYQRLNRDLFLANSSIDDTREFEDELVCAIALWVAGNFSISIDPSNGGPANPFMQVSTPNSDGFPDDGPQDPSANPNANDDDDWLVGINGAGPMNPPTETDNQ